MIQSLSILFAGMFLGSLVVLVPAKRVCEEAEAKAAMAIAQLEEALHE